MSATTPVHDRSGEVDSGRRIAELLRLFTWLGSVGFGGPTAHIALIEDEVVRKRGWLQPQEYAEALAATNILPGPNSTEMAIHVGYRRAGWLGGVASGVAFILPAFLMMIALSWAYFRWNDVAAVADVFEGIAPAVTAVIAVTLWRLFRSSVRDVPQFVLMVLAGALAYVFTSWEPLILIAAGVAGILLYASPLPRPPTMGLSPLPMLLVPMAAAAFFSWEFDALRDLASLFLRAGGLLFGGGYVLIPLVQDDVVDRYHWLTSQQFLDGVALGQTTPGPIVITATFVGYGAAGAPGAVVATVCVFAPAFVFAIAAGRFLNHVRSWKPAAAFLKGVSPAVVGSIGAVSVKLARDSIDEVWAVLVLVAALAIAGKFGPLPALALGGGSGIVFGWVT